MFNLFKKLFKQNSIPDCKNCKNCEYWDRIGIYSFGDLEVGICKKLDQMTCENEKLCKHERWN